MIRGLGSIAMVGVCLRRASTTTAFANCDAYTDEVRMTAALTSWRIKLFRCMGAVGSKTTYADPALRIPKTEMRRFAERSKQTAMMVPAGRAFATTLDCLSRVEYVVIPSSSTSRAGPRGLSLACWWNKLVMVSVGSIGDCLNDSDNLRALVTCRFVNFC
jgi:hypothetical protein